MQIPWYSSQSSGCSIFISIIQDSSSLLVNLSFISDKVEAFSITTNNSSSPISASSSAYLLFPITYIKYWEVRATPTLLSRPLTYYLKVCSPMLLDVYRTITSLSLSTMSLASIVFLMLME